MSAPGNAMARRLLFLAWALLLTLAVGAGLVFYFFNPEQSGFYPKCPLYQTTGLLCPGCGSLRALHQLTHGQVLAALRLNPLLVLVLLPVAGWAVLRTFVFHASGRKWPALFLRQEWCWVLLALVVIFGIARNIRL